jgi:hypothetical protein
MSYPSALSPQYVRSEMSTMRHVRDGWRKREWHRTWSSSGAYMTRLMFSNQYRGIFKAWYVSNPVHYKASFATLQWRQREPFVRASSCMEAIGHGTFCLTIPQFCLDLDSPPRSCPWCQALSSFAMETKTFRLRLDEHLCGLIKVLTDQLDAEPRDITLFCSGIFIVLRL